MKTSNKLSLAALVTMTVAAVVAIVGGEMGSTRIALSSLAFVLFSWAFYSESLVYESEGR